MQKYKIKESGRKFYIKLYKNFLGIPYSIKFKSKHVSKDYDGCTVVVKKVKYFDSEFDALEYAEKNIGPGSFQEYQDLVTSERNGKKWFNSYQDVDSFLVEELQRYGKNFPIIDETKPEINTITAIKMLKCIYEIEK